MCGITGFIDFEKSTPLRVLEAMNATLQHRGPDAQVTEILTTPHAQIGLAHSRLSIIDLSEGGKQPMHYKQYTIVFNGEMYNYVEVKNELLHHGHAFTSYSDTEVILHAFEQWGIECVHKFIGMFTIVLLDEGKNELYFIRDRAGVKPLFLYNQANLILFGSELKSLLKHPKFIKKINHNAVALYLQFGYIPHPYCIYKDTDKVKPGHYIKVDLATREKEAQQYWSVYDAYNKPALGISYTEAKVETEKVLLSACNYRMVSDVPVGVFLSGGYDSTAVTALLQTNRTEKIKTFTIGFDDKKLNEALYAKEVAQHLGTDHTEYYCTEKEALEIFPQLPYYYDEPFADSSSIPTTLVSKLAREKVTVALSADAGDEIFAGYNRYDYILQLGEKIKRIPNAARRMVSATMSAIDADSIPILRKRYLFHSRYNKLNALLRNADDYNMNKLLSTQFAENELSKLLLNKVEALSTAFESKELRSEYYSTLHYIMAIDYETYLVDDILQKVDRATMTHSLEGREPFLDHRVLEWAAQLPMEFKYNKGIKKFILRDIVHQYVPKEMMDRPKMGFSIPVDKWLRNELKPLADHYFSESFLSKQQVFQIEQVREIVHNFYERKIDRAERVWNLLMFQLWYEKWIIETSN